MAEGSGEQNREQNLYVFLNEDSDDDIETYPDIIGEEEYNVSVSYTHLTLPTKA